MSLSGHKTIVDADNSFKLFIQALTYTVVYLFTHILNTSSHTDKDFIQCRPWLMTEEGEHKHMFTQIC